MRIPNYDVEKPIGSGGMSVVYLARHKRLGNKVAIKVLLENLAMDDAVRERFLNEARIMAQLAHPNIVRITDYIEEGSTLALVMEFVEGRTMDKIIGEEVGPIPHEKALPLFLQVLHAVEFAHSNGIIHRDLKPSNVIVSNNDLAKVTDFGIAKIAGSMSSTRTGAKMGTLYYMSPEQIRSSKHVDRRADIYSLGMTLYEMLAGRLPFPGGDDTSEFEVMSTIVQKQLPPPTDFYPHIPAGIVSILMQTLSKDPDDRPSTCRDFANALESGETAVGAKQLTAGGARPVAEEANTCPKCGKPLESGSGFCTHCGARIAGNCAGCGNPLSEGDLFCPICGQKAVGRKSATYDTQAKTQMVEPGSPEEHEFSETAEIQMQAEYVYRAEEGVFVRSLAVSPDGRRLAIGRSDGAIVTVDDELGRSRSFVQSAHSDVVLNLGFSQSGKLLASSGADSTVKLWRADTGEELGAVETSDCVVSMGFLRGGRILVCGCLDGALCEIDIGSLSITREVAEHTSMITSVISVSAGEYFITGARDHRIILWDGSFGKINEVRHSGWVQSMGVDSADTRMACGDQAGNITVYDLSAFKPIASRKVHTSFVRNLAFFNSGRGLVSGAYDDQVKVCSLARADTIAPVGAFSHDQAVEDLVLSEETGRAWSCDKAGLVARFRLNDWVQYL